VLVALLLSVAGEERRPAPPVYAVKLVAAPMPAGARTASPDVVRPPPAVSKQPPKAKPTPVAKQPSPKAPARATPAPRPASPVTPLPGETPGTGQDIANVDLQGKEFPYPEYLRNLVAQIYRRWNRPTGAAALEAEVAFVIRRDGSVSDIRMLRSSRSFSFDQEAEGAVETAALAKAFGPLPAGYGADYLQISFLFTPRQLP
jgi:TonB family protein